jgi:hypothetical protein
MKVLEQIYLATKPVPRGMALLNSQPNAATAAIRTTATAIRDIFTPRFIKISVIRSIADSKLTVAKHRTNLKPVGYALT